MSKVNLLGKLPDPFLKADGTRMSPEEWWQTRDELREKIVRMEYGGMPPKPEVLRIEELANSRHALHRCYRIHAGTREKQLSFILMIHVSEPQKVGHIDPQDGTRFPVLLTGDGCYPNLESDTMEYAQEKGFAVATFNRLEIANDLPDVREGGIYDVYPEEKDFTAISAWAWGYSVALDALSTLPFIDAENVGITGHSRGGKTVLLAAVVDERFRFVCPNNSGTHGCAAYRYTLTEMGDENRRTETLEDMLVAFPHWMGKELYDYKGHVEDLPYDMHYFGALIAPRYYLQCEGMQDYWINPNGSRQTYMAVRACYRYLSCEDHAAAWFRHGFHRHKLPDFEQFIDFMWRAIRGLPTAEHLQLDPYPNEPLAFDF